MDTKKYQFGAGFGEILNESAAISQMWARNKLRNNLVELDRKTRDQFNAIVDVQNPAGERIVTIRDEICVLRDKIKLLRVRKLGDKSLRRKRGSMVADSNKAQHAQLSAVIGSLMKERQDLRAVSKAVKQANRTTYAAAIVKLNTERYAAAAALGKQAVEGYSYTDPRLGKTLVVPALHTCDAEEILNQHDTERTRAMKEGTLLKFHKFQGEGRVFQRIHADRDFTGKEGKIREQKVRAIMAQVRAEKESKKKALSGKASKEKKELSAQYSAIIARLLTDAEAIAPLCIGLSEEELFRGKSPAFKIDPVNLTRDASNPTVWDKSLSRAEQRRRMRTIAHVRIGFDSTKEREERSLYLRVPIVLHRPFPVGTRIVSAAANRKKIGSKFRWSVEFTLRIPDGVETKSIGSNGVLAVDLGWAQYSLPNADGRIRVAGVRERYEDRLETFYEIALPPSYDSAVKKYRELQGIIDQHTNEAFARLAASSTIGGCSTELQSLLARAEQSRKQRAEHPPVGHLRRAVRMTREGEQVTDEIRNILEKWYERYMHLNEWLANGRDNVEASRNDFYRRTAHALAQKSSVLLLDPDSFSKMARTPNPEEDTRTIAGDKRTSVAPSILRNYLIEAFGDKVLWACSLFSSRTCSGCGHINDKLGAPRTFLCAACGFTDDRESNATQNIMNAYVSKPGMFSKDKKVAEKLVEAKEKEAAEESALLAVGM